MYKRQPITKVQYANGYILKMLTNGSDTVKGPYKFRYPNVLDRKYIT